jgi:hypothetical protein
MSTPKRTEDVPHDRLTRICAAMTDVLETHPERGDERCIVFLSSPQERRNGMQLHGYEDDKDAIVGLLTHLRAIFRANGKDLHVVPVGTTPPEDRA